MGEWDVGVELKVEKGYVRLGRGVRKSTFSS